MGSEPRPLERGRSALWVLTALALASCTALADNALDGKPSEAAGGATMMPTTSAGGSDPGAGGSEQPVCALPEDCEPGGFVGTACHQWACANQVCIEQKPEGTPCMTDGGSNGFCNGAGMCEVQNNGETCVDFTTCMSGHCIDDRCCNLPCDGECEVCNAMGFEGICQTTTAGDPDSDCSGGDTCQLNGACCGKAPPPPALGQCPPQCDDCTAPGKCVIECNDFQECKGDTLTCPTGWDCEVRCTDQQACQDATIECQPLYRCIVECSGDQACQAMGVECGDGPCSLDCSGNSCIDAELICGTQQCELICGGGDEPNVTNDAPACAAPTSNCG